MSDTIPANVQEVPGPTRFAVRGQGFQLDVLDTIYQFHDLAEQVRAAEGTHRDYLAAVIELLHTQTGVRLTFGEADWLSDELETVYVQAKKKRRESIDAALTSPSSTASTPEE